MQMHESRKQSDHLQFQPTLARVPYLAKKTYVNLLQINEQNIRVLVEETEC